MRRACISPPRHFKAAAATDAFRRTADPHDDVDTGAFDTGIDSRRNVTVGNELDAGAGAAAFVNEIFMARPVEDDDGQIIDASF